MYNRCRGASVVTTTDSSNIRKHSVFICLQTGDETSLLMCVPTVLFTFSFLLGPFTIYVFACLSLQLCAQRQQWQDCAQLFLKFQHPTNLDLPQASMVNKSQWLCEVVESSNVTCGLAFQEFVTAAYQLCPGELHYFWMRCWFVHFSNACTRVSDVSCLGCM